MTDASLPRVESDTRNGSIKRWYDPFRVTMALFLLVGVGLSGWGAFVFSKATAASDKNIEQDQRLNAIEKAVEKIDGKMDKILDRLPK